MSSSLQPCTKSPAFSQYISDAIVYNDEIIGRLPFDVWGVICSNLRSRTYTLLILMTCNWGFSMGNSPGMPRRVRRLPHRANVSTRSLPFIVHMCDGLPYRLVDERRSGLFFLSIDKITHLSVMFNGEMSESYRCWLSGQLSELVRRTQSTLRYIKGCPSLLFRNSDVDNFDLPVLTTFEATMPICKHEHGVRLMLETELAPDFLDQNIILDFHRPVAAKCLSTLITRDIPVVLLCGLVPMFTSIKHVVCAGAHTQQNPYGTDYSCFTKLSALESLDIDLTASMMYIPYLIKLPKMTHLSIEIHPTAISITLFDCALDMLIARNTTLQSLSLTTSSSIVIELFDTTVHTRNTNTGAAGNSLVVEKMTLNANSRRSIVSWELINLPKTAKHFSALGYRIKVEHTQPVVNRLVRLELRHCTFDDRHPPSPRILYNPNDDQGKGQIEWLGNCLFPHLEHAVVHDMHIATGLAMHLAMAPLKSLEFSGLREEFESIEYISSAVLGAVGSNGDGKDRQVRAAILTKWSGMAWVRHGDDRNRTHDILYQSLSAHQSQAHWIANLFRELAVDIPMKDYFSMIVD